MGESKGIRLLRFSSSSGKDAGHWFLMWYDIITLPIEKVMEQFIGNFCLQSHDARSRVKARRPSLILNGLNYILKLGFNIAGTPTTFSCIFAPFKGIQEESWLRLK